VDGPFRVQLSGFRFHQGERFFYDFTAGWVVDVRLERILAFDPKGIYPRCMAGRRASPPEDCDGPWAYLSELDRHDLRHWGVLDRLAEAVEPFVAAGDLSATHARSPAANEPPEQPRRSMRSRLGYYCPDEGRCILCSVAAEGAQSLFSRLCTAKAMYTIPMLHSPISVSDASRIYMRGLTSATPATTGSRNQARRRIQQAVHRTWPRILHAAPQHVAS
jgi:hypothetical protein